MGPIGVWNEGERVEMRLHIARAARIGVIAPDAADVAGAFEDNEVVDAFLLEPDGGADSTEAAADNCDLHVLHFKRNSRRDETAEQVCLGTAS